MKNSELAACAVLLAALTMISAPAFGNTPAPITVTIVGTFQSEIAYTDDWEANSPWTRLTYNATDDAWQGWLIVPAGSWEYKVALNDSWDEAYGLHAARDGASIALSLPEDSFVWFYYDHKTHWVADDFNSIIATVPGDYVSGMGGYDWQPACLRSWLQDPDGDGIYSFTTSSILPGNYSARVAYYGNWGISYGAGGDPYGPDYEFTVASEGVEMQFVYDSLTNILVIAPAGAENLPPTAVAAADSAEVFTGDTVQLDGSGSTDPEGDPLTYAWTIANAPAGSNATLSGADTVAPMLVPDVEGAYEITLEVYDPAGPGAPVSITVTATNPVRYAETVAVEAVTEVVTLTPRQVSTQGNRTALQNFLKQTVVALKAGDIAGSIDKLAKAIERTDGCALRGAPDANGPGRDWVTDRAAQAELYPLLVEALNALTM